MFLVWFSFSSFVISDSIFEVNFGLISLSVFFRFLFWPSFWVKRLHGICSPPWRPHPPIDFELLFTTKCVGLPAVGRHTGHIARCLSLVCRVLAILSPPPFSLTVFCYFISQSHMSGSQPEEVERRAAMEFLGLIAAQQQHGLPPAAQILPPPDPEVARDP